MLELEIALTEEGWDDEKSEFIPAETVTVQLEHSLRAIRDWESKYHKPCLDSQKTDEEYKYFVKCMLLNKEDAKYLPFMNRHNYEEIRDYINDPATATVFYTIKQQNSTAHNKKIITAEKIYCWMTQAQIPFDCQYWNVRTLLTLIQVCNEENNPDKKKMSKQDTAQYFSELNAKRMAQSAKRKN